MSRLAGTEMIIVYRDKGGNTTKRGISRIQPTGDDAINAFCHLRGEWRTFKIAGIVEAMDSETGELIENPSTLVPARPALPAKPASPR